MKNLQSKGLCKTTKISWQTICLYHKISLYKSSKGFRSVSSLITKMTEKGISTDSEASQREGVTSARRRIGAAGRPLCGGFGTCPGVLCKTARAGKAQRKPTLMAWELGVNTSSRVVPPDFRSLWDWKSGVFWLIGNFSNRQKWCIMMRKQKMAWQKSEGGFAMTFRYCSNSAVFCGKLPRLT